MIIIIIIIMIKNLCFFSFESEPESIKKKAC